MTEVRVVRRSECELEIYASIEGFRNPISVVSFCRRHGEWMTGSSMCLPSGLTAAKQVIECYNKAIEIIEASESYDKGESIEQG